MDVLFKQLFVSCELPLVYFQKQNCHRVNCILDNRSLLLWTNLYRGKEKMEGNQGAMGSHSYSAWESPSLLGMIFYQLYASIKQKLSSLELQLIAVKMKGLVFLVQTMVPLIFESCFSSTHVPHNRPRVRSVHLHGKV